MKYYQRVLSVLLLVTVISLAGCSNPSGPDNNGGTTTQKTAGSISFATTEMSKLSTDSTFTNTLTNTGDGAVSYSSSNPSVATVNASTGEVTIVAPGSTSISATVTDSDTYAYAIKTVSYTLTIRTGVSGKIGSYGKPYAVGDIVFNDGSATPYSSELTLTNAQKNAAVAVIFYVGTECSNNTNIRTLGVGLAHNKSDLKWCIATSPTASTNITTIQCSASGTAGTRTFTGDKDGSDNFTQLASFSGVTDTGTAATYPAWYFAKQYNNQTNSHVSGTSYENDWYLPTICELFYIWKNKTIVDAASNLCGGDKFVDGVYWSSSQSPNNGNLAATLSFSNGDYNYVHKHYGKSVCAIRTFN